MRNGNNTHNGWPEAGAFSAQEPTHNIPQGAMTQPLSENTLREMEALRWEAQPEFFRPDYGRALNCVFPTLFELLGHPVKGYPTLTSVLPPGSRVKARRAFLLCIDALGFKELGRSSLFGGLYRDFGTWITSVFPSITSCALTSLYQGLPPARHGLVGHHIWKDPPGAVVDMLRMQVVGAKASLADSGFDLSVWKREPGILEPGNGAHRGAPFGGMHLMPAPIVNSGLSTYTYGATELVGYLELLEGFTKAGRMLESMTEGWVSLYTPLVDTLSHVVGGDSGQMRIAVKYIEDALVWMAGSLPEKIASETLLIMASDHGQAVTRARLALHGEPMEWLEAHTRAIGFSGRVMHVYLKDHNEEPVAGWLRDFVGGGGRVFRFDEVSELAGEGEDPAWLRRSLGDLVVVLREGHNWEKRAPDPSPYATRLLSQHGAMSWDEMFVPLLCAPFSAFLMD